MPCRLLPRLLHQPVPAAAPPRPPSPPSPSIAVLPGGMDGRRSHRCERVSGGSASCFQWRMHAAGRLSSMIRITTTSSHVSPTLHADCTVRNVACPPRTLCFFEDSHRGCARKGPGCARRRCLFPYRSRRRFEGKGIVDPEKDKTPHQPFPVPTWASPVELLGRSGIARWAELQCKVQARSAGGCAKCRAKMHNARLLGGRPTT